MTTDEIKETALRLLDQIDKVCRDNHFDYSLIGGTLLGAVRHRGFIPWDDDIDICMNRDVYGAFLDYCDAHETPFRVVSAHNDPRYGSLFAKVYDGSTYLTDNDDSLEGTDIGVFVDVFPVDGLGQDKKEAVRQFNRSAAYREILNARNWKYYSRSRTHALYTEPVRLALFLVSRFWDKEKLIGRIESINSEKSFRDSRYAGIVCGSYRKREIMPKSIFEGHVEMEFQGRQYMAIRDHDQYLKRIYGNYMKLPPADKRVSHHTFKAYRRGK